MIRVFKATFNGTDYYDSNLGNILDEVDAVFKDEDRSGKIEIESVLMRQEELDAMPEFNGW